MAAKIRTKKKAETVTPVYFLSLTVENVRCFGEKQTLDLSDGKGHPAQWTILLGENGVGKTTLLQCLAGLEPVETSSYTSSYTVHRIPMAIPRFYVDFESQLKLLRQPFVRGDGTESSYSVSSSLSIGTKLDERKSGKVIDNWLLKGSIVMPYTASLTEYEKLNQFVCMGYGASRRMGEGAISNTMEFDSSASLFSEDVALINAEEWLLQTDYAASKPSPIQKHAQRRLEQIKSILIDLLPDVDDMRFAQPTESEIIPRVEFKTPYGWVSIKGLGLGYKTLIAWMVDFAARMFERYPKSPNPLAEPAIVLVDEIDLHLHPKWQRELINHLTNLFPNTQFIATAHSPLVVQAASNANIVLLRREGDHVIIDNDVKAIRGWRIDQIYTSDLFGLESARPPYLDAAFAEREKILSKSRLTKKDKARLRELESEISNLPYGETSADIEAMDIIRRAAQHIEQQSAPDDSNK